MAEIHTLDTAGYRDDELLSRFIDGELSAADESILSARLEKEPDLARRLATFECNDEHLRALHDLKKVSVAPSIAAQITRVAPTGTQRIAQRPWLAAAASVLVAVGAALQFGNEAPDGRAAPGMNNALASALESLPSRAQGWDALADGREMRAILSFPTANGTWCREFALASEANHWRGVACRHEGSWVTQVMGREIFLDQESVYRPAGGSDNDSVTRFIDATAADVAVSSSREQQLIENGWPAPQS